MNFTELQQAGREFDEVRPLGITVKREGKVYHIAGMTRCRNKAEMYIMEENCRKAENFADRRDTRYHNRAGMKIVPAQSYFSQISKLRIKAYDPGTESVGDNPLALEAESACGGSLVLETESACGGPLALETDCDWESVLVLEEMMKNGWSLPETNTFASMDWKDIWITKLVFRTEVEQLPDFSGKEVYAGFSRKSKNFFVEKPVCLSIGAETQIAFTLEDGRNVICYINKVYLMDVWKDNEEKFQNPRYLEIMTKEELEKHKEDFFRGLEQDCPRGMCYLGIEYECTLEGSVAFYDRAFLEAKPKENKGSARVMLMLLKPDEPIGKHGLKQRGCVIQTPVAPDCKQIEAELFSFMEMLPEWEERLYP